MHRQWMIQGKTYDIKDELKANGCRWDRANRVWITKFIDDNSICLKKIASLCRAVDAEIIPKQTTSDCLAIDDILNKGE